MDDVVDRLPEAGPSSVAALLRARTKDPDGREIGEWSDRTRPTEEQVREQIEIARTLVGVEHLPEPCQERGEATVALLAAMLVEQSYFPEQIRENRSAYPQLAALFEQAQLRLGECAEENAEGGTAGGVYDLDVSGDRPIAWPIDVWQRNLREQRP